MRFYRKQGIVLASMFGMAIAVYAGNIVFTVSGTLSLQSGTDSSGLNGATFTYEATFLDTDTYQYWNDISLERYLSAESAVGTATVSILGSSSNDGTYSLGTSIFAPRYFSSTPNYPVASYFASAASGPPPGDISFTLNDTETFSFQLQMTATASALVLAENDPVVLDDFLGTTPVFYSADPATNLIMIGSGYYSLTGGTVAVPEGKYVSLAFGLAGLGVVGYRRYNRRKAV